MIAPKLYRASTVCEVTGIKPVTLRQWHLRGYYTPESEELPEVLELAPAFGKQLPPDFVTAANEVAQAQRQGWRLYTFEDIVCLLIIHRLTLLGFAVERAAMIAEKCSVHGVLNWPVPRVVERGKVKQRGGTIPRSIDHDSFTVSFLPAEDSLRSAERLTEEHEYSQIMNMLIGHSTESYIGREGSGGLAWAFRDKSTEGDPTAEAEATLFSRNLGVVVNVSAYAREVQTKLTEIENREA